jgi:phosphoserine phosphatase RsbU/P
LTIVRLDPDHIGIYIFDVSGHGVPAALFSATLYRLLSTNPEQSCLFTPSVHEGGGFDIAEPSHVLNQMNQQMGLDPATGKFCTMIYGVLNLQTRLFTYVTAGHPPPLRIGSRSHEACPMSKGIPVGILPDFSYEQISIELQPGDRLLLFTDGAPETVDTQDLEFGTQGLQDVMNDLSDQPIRDCLDRANEAISDWSEGGEQQDDVTLLAIDVLKSTP